MEKIETLTKKYEQYMNDYRYYSEENNNELTKQSLLHAAQTMLKIAELSSGVDRVRKFKLVKEIIDKANRIEE